MQFLITLSFNLIIILNWFILKLRCILLLTWWFIFVLFLFQILLNLTIFILYSLVNNLTLNYIIFININSCYLCCYWINIFVLLYFLLLLSYCFCCILLYQSSCNILCIWYDFTLITTLVDCNDLFLWWLCNYTLLNYLHLNDFRLKLNLIRLYIHLKFRSLYFFYVTILLLKFWACILLGLTFLIYCWQILIKLWSWWIIHPGLLCSLLSQLFFISLWLRRCGFRRFRYRIAITSIWMRLLSL